MNRGGCTWGIRMALSLLCLIHKVFNTFALGAGKLHKSAVTNMYVSQKKSCTKEHRLFGIFRPRYCAHTPGTTTSATTKKREKEGRSSPGPRLGSEPHPKQDTFKGESATIVRQETDGHARSRARALTHTHTLIPYMYIYKQLAFAIRPAPL